MIVNNLINYASEIFTGLSIKYEEYEDRYSMPCYIHGGDNSESLVLYKNTGVWVCFTQHCEEECKKNFLSLIRQLLMIEKKEFVSYQDTIEWCSNLLDKKIEDKSDNQVQRELMNNFSIFTDDNPIEHQTIQPNWYNSIITVPSKYFIGRGFSEEILKKYSVGYCSDKYNSLNNRAVVPLYNTKGDRIIGMTGRTLNPKCLLCKQYHKIGSECVKHSPKWLVKKGTKKGRILYNFNNAKKHMEQTGSVIIVEGTPDIWRLEEANIHIGVCLLGTSLSEYHVKKLNSVGVINVFLATDNDEAGILSKEKTKKKYSKYFNIYDIELEKKDIGDMSIKQVIGMWGKYEKCANY